MNEQGKIHNKKVRFLVDIAFWAVICILIFLSLKFIKQVIPLVLAFVFAAIARPLAKWLSAKTRKKREKGVVTEVPRRISLPKKLSEILSLVLVFLLVGGLITIFVVRAVGFMVDNIARLPEYYNTTLYPALNRAYEWVLRMVAESDQDIVQLVKDSLPSLISSVGSFVTDFSARVVKWAAGIAGKVPSFLLSGVVCVIASFFFAIDFDTIKDFFRRLLSPNAFETVQRVKDSFLDMIWQFIKSYALIFVITVAEITVGLLICGVKNPILIACLIGLFDAFPIVGSGMILLPWAIITLITGSLWRGIGLIIVYAVVVVAREFIEPKIVGTKVGLRPILTLVCMYVGNKLVPIIGLFGFPIAAAIISDMERNGYIRLFWDERHAGEEADGEAVAETSAKVPEPEAAAAAEATDEQSADANSQHMEISD